MAQPGESRADFVHKYFIAQKEIRESLYWLRLLMESEICLWDLIERYAALDITQAESI
ncbi:MAG: four helix bundle protein [bacterium]